MAVTLDTFKQRIQDVSNDASLRFRSDGSITTASRSLGGRIVRWFNGGLDKHDNAKMAGKLMKALSEKHGPDVATKAFCMARADARTTADGATEIRASKPLTARQVRNAMDFASSISQSEAHAAKKAPALLYVPESGAAFDRVATRAQVDVTSLSAAQKAFYKERLVEQVLTKAGSGSPVSPEAAQKLAVKTLKYTVSLDPAELQTARQQVAAAERSVSNLIKTLGGKGGDPAQALMGYLNASDAALAPATLGGATAVGGQDLTQARMQVLDTVVSRLSPATAKRLYDAAMASDGAGRATFCAFGIVRDSVNQLTDDYEHQTDQATGASDLMGQLGFVLSALASRAGADENTVFAKLDTIDDALNSREPEDISARKMSAATLRTAGISGDIRSAVVKASAVVKERAAVIASNRVEGAEDELVNMLRERTEYALPDNAEIFNQIIEKAGIDPDNLDNDFEEQYESQLYASIKQAHADGVSLTDNDVKAIALQTIRDMFLNDDGLGSSI